jgi:hypothetical protein
MNPAIVVGVLIVGSATSTRPNIRVAGLHATPIAGVHANRAVSQLASTSSITSSCWASESHEVAIER